MTRKIERLIESSYSDLSPSPGVEEELLANLPREQVRPQRSLRVPIAALLLIGVAIAIGRSRGGPEAEDDLGMGDGPVESITLATVARPRTGVVAKSTNEVHVRLLHGSGIRIIENKTWTEVNLDELGAHLAKAGRDKWVVLEIDRNAPWVHVQWIMMICAEQRMPKLAFAVKQHKGREFRLDASLATDLPRPRPQIMMSVFAVPRMEQERRWGLQTVRMPTRVVYKFGDREADELASVARWMRAAKKAAPKTRGEIKAMPKTPFETVAKLMAEFRQAGFMKVDFYGTHLPNAAERAARVLPYPASAPAKTTLVFAMVEGDGKDLARAEEIVQRRLERAGFKDFEIDRTDSAIRITLPADADTDRLRQLVERKGVTLVFHITVEPDDPAFADQWRRLKFDGEASAGMRWYELTEHARKTYPKNRLPEGRQPYVLCRTDAYNITGASLSDIWARRNTAGLSGDWIISFRVREEHQQNMADLTRDVGTHLAIILDGEVHSAPVIRSQIRDSVQISGGFSERAAKVLAALLGSEPLPIRLALQR